MKKIFVLMFVAAFALMSANAKAELANEKAGAINGGIASAIVGIAGGPITSIEEIVLEEPAASDEQPDFNALSKQLREINLLLRYISPNPNANMDMIKDLISRKMALEDQLNKIKKAKSASEDMKRIAKEKYSELQKMKEINDLSDLREKFREAVKEKYMKDKEQKAEQFKGFFKRNQSPFGANVNPHFVPPCLPMPVPPYMMGNEPSPEQPKGFFKPNQPPFGPKANNPRFIPPCQPMPDCPYMMERHHHHGHFGGSFNR